MTGCRLHLRSTWAWIPERGLTRLQRLDDAQAVLMNTHPRSFEGKLRMSRGQVVALVIASVVDVNRRPVFADDDAAMLGDWDVDVRLAIVRAIIRFERPGDARF